jgi:hypothetical protein
MLAEKELQGHQHRPRTTFGASSTSQTHTPASSHTPSSTPAAHVGKLPLQVPAKDCPSQRTYIATDDGYISASDGEGDDDDSSDVAANDDAILGTDATVNLRSIMVQRVLSSQPEPSEKQQSNNLFQTSFSIENRRAQVIIDSGSCNNLVSSDLVKKLGLTTRAWPHPYHIQWINDSGKVKVTNMVRVHFSIGMYSDYADCDVVHMEACSLLLGRPWEYDTVGVSTRGVPGPTSKLSPRAPAQMGRRETEREGGKQGDRRKGETRGLRVCPAPRSSALAVGGLQASAREGARGLRAPSRPLRAANLLVREPWTFLL